VSRVLFAGKVSVAREDLRKGKIVNYVSLT
jgi:hypothetical protein